MSSQIRIEIVGRDAFWSGAVIVEWEHSHPERKLIAEASGSYLVESEWLEDLKCIARECFSTIVVAPMDPGRRLWFRQFVPQFLPLRRDRDEE